MKSFLQVTRWCASLLFALVLASTLEAESADEKTAGPLFSRAELEQMLAPIALYPDALLSQVLMAATYPVEVAKAARWSRTHDKPEGQAAVAMVEQYDWDPSVTSLVAFPNILLMMDDKLDWTERVGDAFVAQRDEVMDAIQDLRRVAYEQGHLASGDYLRVVPEERVIIIEPRDANIWYLPHYYPRVVYGPWRWSSHPPVYWDAWPGYRRYGSFGWGRGVGVSASFFFGSLNWRDRGVYTRYHDGFYRSHRGGIQVYSTQPRPWRHDAYHRRGVPYGDGGQYHWRGDVDGNRYDRDNYRPEPDRFRHDHSSDPSNAYPRHGYGYPAPSRYRDDHDDHPGDDSRGYDGRRDKWGRDNSGRDRSQGRDRNPTPLPAPPAGFNPNRPGNEDPRVPQGQSGNSRPTIPGDASRPGRFEARGGRTFSSDTGSGSGSRGSPRSAGDDATPRFDASPRSDGDYGGSGGRPGRYEPRSVNGGERSGNPGGRSPGGFSHQ